MAMVAATMAVKPEEDFQGYMESIEQNEAEREKVMKMLQDHEVRKCVYVFLSALRLFSPSLSAEFPG
jgi:hypothetical protein